MVVVWNGDMPTATVIVVLAAPPGVLGDEPVSLVQLYLGLAGI